MCISDVCKKDGETKMEINKLSKRELIWNLQQLHDFLNKRFFEDELDPIMIEFENLPEDQDSEFRSGEAADQIIINIHTLTTYKCLIKSIPNQAEMVQHRWLITIMLHAMADQYMKKHGVLDPEEIAERFGLMLHGTKTEWVYPLWFDDIQKEFEFRYNPELWKEGGLI